MGDPQVELKALDDPSLEEDDILQICRRSDAAEVARKAFMHGGISHTLFRLLLPWFVEDMEKNPNYKRWYRSGMPDYRDFDADLSALHTQLGDKDWPYREILENSGIEVCPTTVVNSRFARENLSREQCISWLEQWRDEHALDEPNLMLALPDTSEEELHEAINENHLYTLLRIAPKPDLSRVLFEKLAANRKWEVRERVAKNMAAPLDILQTLARDRKAEVAAAARENPAFQPETQATVELSWSGKPRQDTLDAISQDELGEAQIDALFTAAETAIDRFYLALLQKPTPAVIDGILKEEDWVKASLAYNPHTPLEILTTLATVDHKDVRFALALNPNLPVAESLTLLQSDNRRLLHYLLATTRHDEVLDAVRQETPDVDNIKGAYAILLNPKSKSSDVGKLITRGNFRHYSDIARRVAQHPNCPAGRFPLLMAFFPKELKANPAYKMQLLEKAKKVQAKPFTKRNLLANAQFKSPKEYECEKFFDDTDTKV